MGKFDFRRFARSVAGRPDELMFSVVAGAATNTNIAVSAYTAGTTTPVNIGVKDGLVAVLHVQPPTAASGNTILADLVSEAAVTSAGNIQLSTTTTTGNQLLVIWYRRRD